MFAVNKKHDRLSEAASAKNNRSQLSTSKSNPSATDKSSSIIKGRPHSSPPTTVNIRTGIVTTQVHFPFRPYDVQVEYMKSVLTALQNSQHALLESPTGTGKTLCLLCSALAWQRAEKARIRAGTAQSIAGAALAPAVSELSQINNTPQEPSKTPIIIYASRTHSQLSQVVRELRNTRYRPRHAVLGSRDHMCVHPKVNPIKSKNDVNSHSLSASEVNHGCNKLNKERKCVYRNNLDEIAGKGTWTPPSTERVLAGGEDEQPVLDMEDLVSVGKQHRICPFYHSRSLVKEAELIFIPYNYLFHRDARESTLAEVDFTNAVLIFDEAHNLEEFASESSSFDLSSSDVAGCVGEVQRALQYLELNPEMGDGNSMKDNLLRLKKVFLRFEQYLLEGYH